MESLDKKQLVTKLYNSRSRILIHSPFFSSIIYQLSFKFSNSIGDISTDGESVFINPSYLATLSDSEVDIVILHILLHIAFKHHLRKRKEYDDALYHLACDMIVNSNIINYIYGDKVKELYVKGKKLQHLSPENKEGYLYSVTDLYHLLLKTYPMEKNQKKPSFNTKNDVIIDSFVSKATPKMQNKIGYIISKTGGVKRLKEANLIAKQQAGNYAFYYDDIDDDYNDIQEDLSKSLTNYQDISDDEIKIDINDRDPIPSYKYLDLANNTYRNKEIKFDELVMRNIINNIHNSSITKRYINDIHKSYLNITKEQRDYFDKLEPNINFSSKDIASKIIMIRNYIASSAIYNCEAKPYPNHKDYVVYFLDEIKEGDCKHFAMAALSMYRYYNIPARLVGGLFVDANVDSKTTVYEENGHAWIEVFIDNVGWITVDATPVMAYRGDNGGTEQSDNPAGIDSHNKWKDDGSLKPLDEDIIDQMISQGNELSKMAGKQPPAGIRKIIEEMTDPALNWREMLNTFIQEEVNDYTFFPPDHRYGDSEFLLPDFNDHSYEPEKIIIMMDTSGSISEKEITDFINEVRGAIELYDNKLLGFVGFFDTAVRVFIPIEEFSSDTLAKIPGGGGTDFYSFMNFIKKNIEDDEYRKVIVFTDGCAPFPPEDYLPEKEVLWVIDNDKVTPPWGRVLRYKKED